MIGPEMDDMAPNLEELRVRLRAHQAMAAKLLAEPDLPPKLRRLLARQRGELDLLLAADALGLPAAARGHGERILQWIRRLAAELEILARDG